MQEEFRENPDCMLPQMTSLGDRHVKGVDSSIIDKEGSLFQFDNTRISRVKESVRNMKL